MTLRLAWVTDPHFDHATVASLTAHVRALHAAAPDAVLVTGDLATAAALPRWLRAYRRMAECPLYFVLGNHDFWGSSVAAVRAMIQELAPGSDGVHYLTGAGPLTIAPGVALVGHDGWYDAREGNWEAPRFRMQDWERIGEYAGATDHEAVVRTSRALADAAEEELLPRVEAAARDHVEVVIATHVPPWPLPAGRARHPDGGWIAPWYVAARLGEALARAAAAHPGVRFRVLAGHAHARRSGIQPAPNLTCDVGWASYGMPAIERILEFGER